MMLTLNLSDSSFLKLTSLSKQIPVMRALLRNTFDWSDGLHESTSTEYMSIITRSSIQCVLQKELLIRRYVQFVNFKLRDSCDCLTCNLIPQNVPLFLASSLHKGKRYRTVMTVCPQVFVNGTTQKLYTAAHRSKLTDILYEVQK